MSLRSRIAERPAERSVEVAKVYGPGVPESFRQGEIAAQMTPASPFSPGQPIGPYDGYDRFPRTYNFQAGYNIATRPRTHERVSFEILTSLIRSYDISQICIWHRIDSIRSLKWKLLSAEHYFGDVTDAIPLGVAALKKPDRKRSFKTWLAMYLWDILATDSGCLYRIRNRGGRAIGLKVVSGPTIAPLLDYWGDSPDAPAEAYVQYINGLPWGWLTRDDVIYEPFRPQPDSPYGTAPIESVVLNCNTDVRHQLYFLQRFTEGNLPAAFAAAPESWSPDQIEQFQVYWDAMVFGDQSAKHQIKWMPPGSKFEWSNEKDFSDLFSLFMLRKTAAAYHVVPSDLGLTENVNRSSGESQADVQHRVGDLPLMEHVEGILSAFLYDDLRLPLRFEFDRGEEQVDQLAQAEADQKYMDRAVVSPSEIREMRYGLTDSEPVPRAFFSERAGPIPVISLMAVAGPVDPQTAAPPKGAQLPHKAFTMVEGVVTSPPLIAEPLAEQEYGPSALPPGQPVAKEGEAAATPGINSETGLYGDPLIRGEDEDDEPDLTTLVAKEMAAFRRFRQARRKSGEWRDFTFRSVGPVQAHNLNDSGRLAVRKAAGEVAVAGLAVLAADTGRVLMLQRALCDDDPAAGKLEFPGGHLEDGESPLEAAWREWSEETGAVPPPGTETGSWVSPNGIYQGIVWTTAREASVPVRGDAFVPNPDDPDGDAVEAILWFDPADLPGNPAVRAELLENIDAVLAALGLSGDGQPACCGSDCCAGGCCDGTGGCTCGTAGSEESEEADPVLVAAVEKRRAELAGIDRLMRTPPAPRRGQRARHRAGGDGGPKGEAVRKAALDLANLTGIWAAVYGRREKLLARHAKAVSEAWDACVASLGSPRAAVRSFRAEAIPVAKAADPDRERRKDAGTAAVLAWLDGVYQSEGWAALVGAIEDAIRDGTAEGEADALALAADRQGVTGFVIGRAFTAAAERLQGDPGISQKAQDAAAAIVAAAAASAGRALADQAGGDGSEQDMTAAVTGAVAGSGSPAGDHADWALWSAILAGAVALYARAASSGSPPPPPGTVLLDWITAGDGRVCATCQGYADNGPYAPEDVPDYPHNRCRCSVDTVSSTAASFLAALLASFTD